MLRPPMDHVCLSHPSDVLRHECTPKSQTLYPAMLIVTASKVSRRILDDHTCGRHLCVRLPACPLDSTFRFPQQFSCRSSAPPPYPLLPLPWAPIQAHFSRVVPKGHSTGERRVQISCKVQLIRRRRSRSINISLNPNLPSPLPLFFENSISA